MLRAVTFERWIERYRECNIDVRLRTRDFFPRSLLDGVSAKEDGVQYPDYHITKMSAGK